jgi:hypothetical protein
MRNQQQRLNKSRKKVLNPPRPRRVDMYYIRGIMCSGGPGVLDPAPRPA